MRQCCRIAFLSQPAAHWSTDICPRVAMTRTITTRQRTAWFRKLVLLFLLALANSISNAAPDFSREVRPLFETHCLKCHGPETQKGGLRFDTKEGAFKSGESGEKAIVPGNASQSHLIKLISSTDDAERMPSKGDALSAPQIDLLKRWIDAGADWPETAASTGAVARAEMIVTDEDRKHWSFLPLTNPP